jgi:hypothetical protein
MEVTVEPAVLSPTEIRELAGLLYAALRPAGPRPASQPRPERVRALLRRVRAFREGRLTYAAIPHRRAG